MNRYKENKRSMYLALITWYLANQAECDAIPGFTQWMEEVVNNSGKIDVIRAILEIDITSYATEKTATRDVLEQKSLAIALILKGYAINTNNAQLKTDIGFTWSDLRNAADTVLYDRCALILTRGGSNVAAMPATYGLTQIMIDEAEALNTKYHGLIPMPRVKIAEKKIKKEEMDQLFRLVDKALYVTDDLIDIIRFSNETLWKGYQAVRMIIDLKGKQKNKEITTGIEGVITDLETDQPISNVEVTANTTDKKAQSDDEGYYKLALPVGESKVTYKANGYVLYVETVIIEEGVLYDNDVELEKPEPA